MVLAAVESEATSGAASTGADGLRQPDGGSAGQSRQPPTSAEIDAVIAAAMANAPPAPPVMDLAVETSARSLTPLMTNILPSAIGSDGRVNLFVGNLPYRVRWQDLKDLFRKAGTVLRADVSLGPDNRSRGYGNVLMGSREDAARAIDRFNGFTWQTRTLEVRPDRLPPEYEPQPHVHHKHMYGGFGPGPMQHFPGAAGGWPHRPPHHGPPFGQFGHQGHPHGGGPQHFGRAPHLAAAGVVPVGASPLAGSLTGGAPHAMPGPAALGPGWGRESLAPFNEPSAVPGRSVSPLGQRPASPSNKLADEALRGGRIAPTIGPKPGFAPDFEAPHRPVSRGPELPIAPMLNGLGSHTKDFGSPNTLMDRIVFVKNFSSTTQWQDLKDFFRPAGVVIRADVATSPDGQSRGFGTVLFASKDDAAKSVTMFNGREVDGHVLHVQTERQTLEDKQIQPIHPHPVETFPAFGAKASSAWSQAPLPPAAGEQFPPPGPSPSTSPSSTRVPWQLNTLPPDPTTTTPPRKEAVADDSSQRHGRHPGPIVLPPMPLLGELNPLSPLQTRNLPPMTPSMPGFVFNANTQQSSRSQFLSVHAGPFSPGLLVTSPLAGRRSPFLNAAPGAPVLQAPQGGSAALGTPTTQSFPHGAPSIDPVGPPGDKVNDDYFPTVGASPLNGRERLASTVDDLALGTANMSLSNAPRSTTPTPMHKRSTSGGKLAPSPPTGSNGRNSFDGPRQNLGVWNSERRASWSEVAGGGAGQSRS